MCFKCNVCTQSERCRIRVVDFEAGVVLLFFSLRAAFTSGEPFKGHIAILERGKGGKNGRSWLGSAHTILSTLHSGKQGARLRLKDTFQPISGYKEGPMRGMWLGRYLGARVKGPGGSIWPITLASPHPTNTHSTNRPPHCSHKAKEAT